MVRAAPTVASKGRIGRTTRWQVALGLVLIAAAGCGGGHASGGSGGDGQNGGVQGNGGGGGQGGGPATPMSVQSSSSDPQTHTGDVSASFTTAESSGDLNFVAVAWANTTATITSVTDTAGNAYQLALSTATGTDATQAIYYAGGIAAAPAGNAVTVMFNGTADYPDLRIVEYSGINPTSPLDGVIGSSGTSDMSSSGSLTTTNANDLLVAANYVAQTTSAADPAYTLQLMTSPDGDLVEDRLVSAAGPQTASATLSASGWWVMQLAAFRAAAGPSLPAPTSLLAKVVSGSQINLAWTASAGATSYLVERCQGAGCSSFAQIGMTATTTSPTFQDTGLGLGMTYSYRVRAKDAAGDLSGYSNVASATTTNMVDTTPPTAPSNLVATGTSPSQIGLTWTAATDDVGVTSYLVERCQGAGCTSFTQIGTAATSTSTSYIDTGLTMGTSYSYRVRASDGAGNLGPYSNVATAMTTTGTDGTAPTAPSNLVATALSSVKVSLTWTASTDNVGVTNYLVERCAGFGCSNFAQVGTAPGPAFTDGGLFPSDTYSYRVRATDAAMNLSAYSNVATTTTKALPPPATFVQCNSATPQSLQSTVTVTFTAAQTAGDLNVVFAAWTDSVTTVSSVTDSAGNVYVPGLAPTTIAGTATEVAYYAKNIVAAAAGSNTVTVTFNGMAPSPDVRIAEYAGLDTVNPLDVAAGTTGIGTLATTGSFLTTSPADLVVSGNFAQWLSTDAGPGETLRLLTPASDVLEDEIAYVPGYQVETVSLQVMLGWYVMQAMAFRVASSPMDTTPPSIDIGSPAAGATVTGNVTVTIDADDVSGVLGAELLVDGLPMQGPAITSPYTVTFNSALYANGTHSLQAYAWDPYQNVAYSTAVSVTFSNATPANPAQDGVWSGTFVSPIVSTISALLPGGRVLTWEGQSWGFDVRVWDPQFNSWLTVPAPVNPFCAGVQQMADGRIFVVGGHVQGHTGLTALNAFDPATNSWDVLADMAFPRWYGTGQALPDGRMIIISGETNCDNCDVTTPEIYDPVSNTTTQLTNSQFFFNFFPHVFTLPDGRVLVSSTIEAPTVSQVLDLNAGTWTPIGGPQVDGGVAVMYLPGKVLKTGKSFDPDDPATPSLATAYVLDATQASPTWQSVAPMNVPRSYHNLTLLPDGTVLVTGGGPTTAGTDTANATLTSEIWSPTTQTFTALKSTMNAPRLYHFSSLLMPDGRVMALGGGRFDDVSAPTDQYSGEFFAPPYLFKGPRPVITSAPTKLQYGQPFTVATPDAARIGQVNLLRYGATTHTFNMGQSFIPLSFTVGSNSLTATAPANGNLAPPGNYLLFILDTNGIPSVAATVHF